MIDNKCAVVMPFNRCDLYKPEPFRYRRTMSRSAWWKRRAVILDKYTMPSLMEQEYQDFTIWGLFLEHDIENAGPIIDILNKYGAYSVIGSNNETLLEGSEKVRAFYHNHCNCLTMIHMDSDDMYTPDAIKLIMDVTPCPGRVIYFPRGYLYGAFSRKMAVFHAPKHPPPFLAMVFTNDSLSSEEKWQEYRKKWKMNTYHHKVHHCPKAIKIDGCHFCYMIHDENVVTSWNNPHTYNKIVKHIGRDANVGRILRFFGLCSHQAAIIQRRLDEKLDKIELWHRLYVETTNNESARVGVADKPVQQPQVSDIQREHQGDTKWELSTTSVSDDGPNE